MVVVSIKNNLVTKLFTMVYSQRQSVDPVTTMKIIIFIILILNSNSFMNNMQSMILSEKCV